MSFKRVAIIGSNGFLGSHLTNRLRELPGISLFLFGRSEVSVFGDEFPYSNIDLSDADSVCRLFADIDIIYYLASGSIPASSWNDPVFEVEKNLLPFLKFMEAITTLGVKKIVFTSSAGTIYGPSSEKVTETANKSPFSPHGIVKLTMEHFLNYFRVRSGLNYDVYRISNVYGPGQNTGKGLGIINTFLENIDLHRKINIFGNGEAVRNYLYVKDLAELMLLSMTADAGKSETFNAASDDTLTINELVATMKTVVDEDFEVIYTASRQSDNPAISLDNSKIIEACPDFRFTSISDGIRETYGFIKG